MSNDERTCRGCRWLELEEMYAGRFCNICTNEKTVRRIGSIKYRIIGTPGARQWAEADPCYRPAWCDKKENI